MALTSSKEEAQARYQTRSHAPGACCASPTSKAVWVFSKVPALPQHPPTTETKYHPIEANDPYWANSRLHAELATHLTLFLELRCPAARTGRSFTGVQYLGLQRLLLRQCPFVCTYVHIYIVYTYSYTYIIIYMGKKICQGMVRDDMAFNEIQKPCRHSHVEATYSVFLLLAVGSNHPLVLLAYCTSGLEF